MMSSIFFCCKTKTIIWQARKNERTIVYCLPRKKYLAKMNTLFYQTFFRYEQETDVNKVMKNKIQYVGSRTISPEKNWLPTLNLTLYLIQTLILARGNFPWRQLSGYRYALKKQLFKTIIVFTSIYFESYRKIPARSNKSILQSFYHKIHVHVKDILTQNKKI